MHITMLKYSKNDLGYIQVVTHADNKSELEEVGFVDSVEKVKEPKKPIVKKAVKAVKDGK